LVLNGIIKQRGVLAPMSGEINEPLINEPLINEPLINEPLINEPLINEPLINELREKYGIECIEKTIA
jgi:hypothetical protein